MLITIKLGNIVHQPDCDANVNSANQNLRAGSGVCGAIHRAAGPELEPCSIQQAPLSLGAAVITPAFNLPNRFVIHPRGPKYFFDEDPQGNLAAAMRNTLLVADENKLARIAVPAISMGIFRTSQMRRFQSLFRQPRRWDSASFSTSRKPDLLCWMMRSSGSFRTKFKGRSDG